MNKNSRWFIFGSIVVLLAVVIAIGPIFVARYMRAKWQNGSDYKASNALMQIKGIVQVSSDNQYYLKSEDESYYVFENLNQDLSTKTDQQCNVLAKIRVPENNETIDGNVIRLFITPSKIVFDDKDNAEININREELNKKIEARAKMRVDINTALNTPIMFDVIKGKVSKVIRQNNSNRNVAVYVLIDEFGDSYMLYRKGEDLSSLENRDIICLGRQIMPLKNMPFVMDEVTFEIYGTYDFNLNKIY